MINLEIKNIKSHPSLSLAKANASRDLQINFNQAEDALTIPTESRHDYKCGFATQSGRSMIEMLGVLAIIGVLSVGGIAGYSKAMMKYRINKTIEQITLIAGNVRAFWGPQGNYEGADCSSNDGTCPASGCQCYDYNAGKSAYNGCPIVKKAKIFPDEMITVTDGKIMSITNPFGGGVVLGSTDKSYDDNDNKAFYIELHNIPEEACIELATYDWTVAGADIISWEYADITYTKVPLDLETAVKQCEESHDFFTFVFDADTVSWMNNN